MAAGGNRLPPHSLSRDPIADPRLHHHIAALEDSLAAQQRDLQTLLVDNQRLASSHVSLKQDLAASRHDLRLLSDSAARSKSDCDAEVRGLYERSVRAEEEVRRVEAMKEKLMIVRSDLVKLGKDRNGLVERAEDLKGEMGKARGEIAKVEEVRAEIAFMRREIERGRAAVEYEKKAHTVNLEQSKAMEKNLILMARELEKLRAELANAEKRARASAAKPVPGYTENYGDSAMPHGGTTYTEPHGFNQVQ